MISATSIYSLKTVSPGERVTLRGRVTRIVSANSFLLEDFTGVVHCYYTNAGADGFYCLNDICEINGVSDKIGVVRVECIKSIVRSYGKGDKRWRADKKKRDILLKRSKIISAIRDFFNKKEFVEVETPLIVRTPDSNPNIHSFKVYPADSEKNKKNASDFYLSASPEHAMKMLLCSGFERIFQIAKFFRSGEMGEFHNPEFTGLEWYETYSGCENIMNTCEELFVSISEAVGIGCDILLRERGIDLSPPWKRISVHDAFLKYAGIDLYKCEALQDFIEAARKSGEISISDEDTWSTLFFKVFLHFVERRLHDSKPIFLYEYPSRLPSLARKKSGNKLVVERFEIFAGGMELGNAFAELNDPVEQKERFIRDLKTKYPYKSKDELPLDNMLISALEYGMPPCGGIALGLDRLIMLLLGCSSIEDVIYLPWYEYD